MVDTNYIVNLETLNKFEDGATVNAAALKEAGIIKKELDGVKVLGNHIRDYPKAVRQVKSSPADILKVRLLLIQD